ncbi:MAG: septum formation initiator family protein [bacterium]
MKSKKGWKKWAVCAAVLGVIGQVGFLAEYNFYHLLSLERNKHELRARIKQSEQEREALSLEIHRLENDTTYIERIAREQFKMGKDGETIYIIQSGEIE